MRRADRLFDIIQVLRTATRPITATALAAELEVTPRTVYRDIATLQARRVPIEGAPGLGYVLRRGFDLPPLMFTSEEIEAIVVRDRKHLSEEGVVIPIIAIDKHTGKLESAPEVVSRGLMSENNGELLEGAKEIVMKTFELSNLEERADWSVIKEKIRVDLKRYISKQTSKRPLILPVILEV